MSKVAGVFGATMTNLPAAFMICDVDGSPNPRNTFNAAHSENSETINERPRKILYAFLRVFLPASKINP